MVTRDAAKRSLAAAQFHRARRQAAMEQIIARLTGKSADLLSYDDVAAKLRPVGQSSLGVRQIPVSAIVGSVGRYTDFSRTFLPRREEDEDRWVGVRAAASVVTDLPPIDVYRLGDSYFVLDGNHRVSIARRQGIDYIDANIIDVRTRAPLPPGARPDDLIIAAEYAAFLERTRLDVLRPGADLRVSAPGQYDHLEAHIEARRYLREADEERELSDDEAVGGWYDEAYLPLVEAIREQGILRYFPGRTETDFYVWLARHRVELEHELGWEIRPDVAVSRLLERAVAQAGAEQPTGRLRRVVTTLVAPAQPSPPVPGSWSQERALYRYSERLFQDVLVPLTGIETEGDFAARLPYRHALALAVEEQAAALRGLLVLPFRPEPEQADDLRRRFIAPAAEIDLPATLTIETGDPVERAVDRAGLSDVVVVDSRFGGPQGVKRLIRSIHRPVYVVGPSAEKMVVERVLLLFDGRAESREALFLAAYLAEQWGVGLVVLPFGTGAGGSESPEVQARRYLAMHELDAVYAVPSNEGDVARSAAKHGCGLIVAGGYGRSGGRGRNGRSGRQTELLDELLEHWAQALIVCP